MSSDPLPYTGDVHLILVRVWLAMQGAVGVLFMLVSPFSGWMAGTEDPAYQDLGPVGGALMFGLMGLCCFGSVGLLGAASSYGLGEGRKWAWWTSMISMSMLCLGVCLPIGLYGFWVLLRVEVRHYFGVR